MRTMQGPKSAESERADWLLCVLRVTGIKLARSVDGGIVRTEEVAWNGLLLSERAPCGLVSVITFSSENIRWNW